VLAAHFATFFGFLRGITMLKRLAQLSLFLALITMASQAQSNYATLRGEVTDPQHLPVPGAEVRITSELTGATRYVTTDNAGLYVAGGLQPGGYQVEIDKNGFAIAKQSLQLEVGQKATLDIPLSLGSVLPMPPSVQLSIATPCTSYP
jgi:hypothetical protein